MIAILKKKEKTITKIKINTAGNLECQVVCNATLVTYVVPVWIII